MTPRMRMRRFPPLNTRTPSRKEATGQAAAPEPRLVAGMPGFQPLPELNPDPPLSVGIETAAFRLLPAPIEG